MCVVCRSALLGWRALLPPEYFLNCEYISELETVKGFARAEFSSFCEGSNRDLALFSLGSSPS